MLFSPLWGHPNWDLGKMYEAGFNVIWPDTISRLWIMSSATTVQLNFWQMTFPVLPLLGEV